MNKLTEMINLKAAILSAVALTTFSGFTSKPAQAFFPIGGTSLDEDSTDINFNLDLVSDPSFTNFDSSGKLSFPGVVDNFNWSANLDDIGTFDLGISFTDGTLNVEKNCCNFNKNIDSRVSKYLDYAFDNYFILDENPSSNFLLYSVRFFGATTTGSSTKSVNGLFVFAVPKDKGLQGLVANDADGVIVFDDDNFLKDIGFKNGLNSLEAIADGLVNPLDEGPATEDILVASLETKETVPESSTSISLLALGSLGVGLALKRKVKQTL